MSDAANFTDPERVPALLSVRLKIRQTAVADVLVLDEGSCIGLNMKYKLCLFFMVAFFSFRAFAAPKPHTIVFGKWTIVKFRAGPEEKESLEFKIRALYVDGRAKEFTIGLPHDTTDRLFVVRRAVRLNDSLPDEPNSPRWIWQRDGWILVDRASGRVSAISLPQFDNAASEVSWYRDYAAYCGRSDNGQKIYAMVAQLGRRKPILSKFLEDAKNETGGSACPPPAWQRQPPRVSFTLSNDQRLTYAVSGHAADAVDESEEEE